MASVSIYKYTQRKCVIVQNPTKEKVQFDEIFPSCFFNKFSLATIPDSVSSSVHSALCVIETSRQPNLASSNMLFVTGKFHWTTTTHPNIGAQSSATFTSELPLFPTTVEGTKLARCPSSVSLRLEQFCNSARPSLSKHPENRSSPNGTSMIMASEHRLPAAVQTYQRSENQMERLLKVPQL